MSNALTGKYEGDESEQQVAAPEDDASECDVSNERRHLMSLFLCIIFTYTLFHKNIPTFLIVT